MLDGGPGAELTGPPADWLVSDERSEPRGELRALSAARGLHPAAAAVCVAGLMIEPHPVAHTSHPTWGYLLRLPMATAAWAAGADLMFADAAGWNRAIRFARGAGGHMAAPRVAEQARGHRVAQLVFAHIGRPSLRDRCRLPPAVREWAEPGRTYQLPPQAHSTAPYAR